MSKNIVLWKKFTTGNTNNIDEGTINLQEYVKNPIATIDYLFNVKPTYYKYDITRIPPVENIVYITIWYNVVDLNPTDIVNIYNDIRNGKMFVEGITKIYTIDETIKIFRNTVFPYWCSQKSNTPLYATDPINGKILKEASYFRSNTNLGLYCRLWEIDPNAVGAEEAKIGYCTANPNSFECDCINSKNSTYYKAFNNPDNVPEQCWYKPCNMKTNAEGFDDYVYFVPKSKQNPVCPPNINVTFNTNQTLVTKEEADKYFATPPTPPGPTPPGPTPPKPTPPGPTPSFFDKYKWYIIIFGSLLLLILILFFVK